MYFCRYNLVLFIWGYMKYVLAKYVLEWYLHNESAVIFLGGVRTCSRDSPLEQITTPIPAVFQDTAVALGPQQQTLTHSASRGWESEACGRWGREELRGTTFRLHPEIRSLALCFCLADAGRIRRRQAGAGPWTLPWSAGRTRLAVAPRLPAPSPHSFVLARGSSRRRGPAAPPTRREAGLGSGVAWGRGRRAGRRLTRPSAALRSPG